VSLRQKTEAFRGKTRDIPAAIVITLYPSLPGKIPFILNNFTSCFFRRSGEEIKKDPQYKLSFAD